MLWILSTVLTVTYRQENPQHSHNIRVGEKKGKAIPLQAWTGPEGTRRVRLTDFVTTAYEGGKVVSLTHRPLLPLRKCSWYSFLLEAETTPGP